MALRSTSLKRAQDASKNGSFASEIAPVTVKAGKGEIVDRARRAAVQGEPRQDPATEAGVPQGRHGDGGQFELDLRRRRGARADAAVRSAEARADAAGAHRRRTRRMRRSPAGSRPRRSARSRSCSKRPAGTQTTSICTRSTKRSRSSRWPPCATSTCRTTRSTCTAAPARSAIRSAPPARASSSRCSPRCEKYGSEARRRRLCIGGGEATAMAIERIQSGRALSCPLAPSTFISTSRRRTVISRR